MTRITLILAGALIFAGAAGLAGASSAGEDPKEAPSIATLVAEGRLGELQQRIESGVAPEAGLTATVRYDSEEALRLVLELGADPKGLPASRTLLRAKLQGLGWATEILEEAGADLEARDSYGRTLLILAVQKGSVPRVRDLVSAGADVNARSNIGTTVLMEAVIGGRPRMVKALLRSEVDLEAEDRDGWTALAWAVRVEDTEAVRLLLSRGAKPNHIDRLGWTPLMLASAQGNPMLVHELLRRGALPGLGTPSVGPPLIRAVFGGNRDVVQLLLAYGADRRSAFAARKAFEWAESLGRIELVDLLTPRGRGP